MKKNNRKNAKQSKTRKATTKTSRSVARKSVNKKGSNRKTKPTAKPVAKGKKLLSFNTRRKTVKSTTTKIKKVRNKNAYNISVTNRKIGNKIDAINKTKIPVPKGFVKGAFIIVKDKKGNVVGTELTRPELFIDEKSIKDFITKKVEQMNEDFESWTLNQDNSIPYSDINPETIHQIEIKYF